MGSKERFILAIKFYSESAQWARCFAIFPPVVAPQSLQPLGRSCQNNFTKKEYFTVNNSIVNK